MKFSVLMSVYKNDDPNFFIEALESVFNQTVSPTEVILVEDGPLTVELKTAITLMCDKFNGSYCMYNGI